MTYTPREEQETIFNFDAQLGEWTYYSDVPKHNRKWDELIQAQRKEVDPNGQITLLEGIVKGNVNINKPKKMSKEQKAAISERMRKLRKDQIDSEPS